MTSHLTSPPQLSGLSIGDQFVADYVKQIEIDEIRLDNKNTRVRLTVRDYRESFFGRLYDLGGAMPEEVNVVDFGFSLGFLLLLRN